MAICPACGQENPEGSRFCNSCGAGLEAAAPAREERKIVTVLFADLVGFTSRAERMDPEDVRALLAPYHAHLRSELEHYGGTVEKFIGDAVMALFGAPLAREDDPERAVRAALAIRDWIRGEEADLQLRIAVNTGEALIALGARPEAGEGMASGDVVNTTARLQSAAPVNGILAGETTYRATRHVIDYREVDPVQAKGKTEAVSAWEAVEARSRFGVDVRQHGAAPLVGRDRELGLLVGALERVQEERSSQLLTLVGAPGIGKSRLVYELFGAIERGTTLVYWRQGRSLSYGEGVSFWALAEMVKAQAGIREDDSPDIAAGRLRRAVRELVAEKEADWLEAHLRPLAGLGGTEAGLADRRDESFAAWRRFFEAMAERRPLVLVFEDLHWADEGLLDFVDHLVDWAGSVPLLVVATARPELLERRAAWGGGKLNAATIMLSPLREDDTARLVSTLLDRSVLAAETQSVLLERAGGNPLYAEQFARLYQERGAVEELPVPESVQGIIAARLDGLSSEEKELIQDAAVLGKVFWVGALRRDPKVVRAALHSLERKDFVRRERQSSVEEDEEYAFRHLLVRDVAYGQIPRSARADKHHLAATWIEGLGRAEDHAEMVAHHYLAAIDYARAAGREDSELAEPARLALRDAGDRAFALNSFAAGARLYERALELWPAQDTGRPRLLLQLAQAQHLAGDDRREETLERARQALMSADDHEGAAEADAVLAEFWWHRGDAEGSHAHLERARVLVADVKPSVAKARVLSQLSRYEALAERSEQAIALGLEAVEMAEAFDLPELQAHALNNVGVAKVHLGDETGFGDLERSIEIALVANSSEVVRGYNNLGAITWDRGDFVKSCELFKEATRLGEQFGTTATARYARVIAEIQQLFPIGDWDEGLSRADAFIAACEAGEPHYLESDVRRTRAFARLARDDVEGAVSDLEKALEQFGEAGDPQALLPNLSVAVTIYMEAGLVDEAQAAAKKLLPYLEEPYARPSLVIDVGWVADRVSLEEPLRQMAARAPLRTRWVDALLALLDKDFVTAADTFAAIGTLDAEALARLRAAERLVSEGRRIEADEQLRQALAFYRSVGATRYIREGEALLAAAS
jgi:class 3 adenylate cyclase/tetratricopeptide (TPR) repeat protein